MANRAYLFSTNINDHNKVVNFEKPYYDSRWNIPLLWFLFFSNDSIKMKTCYLDEDIYHVNDSWEQVILFENREIAISKFSKNLELLTKIWKNIEVDKEVLSFIENVRQWNGKYIVLEPFEIVEDHPKAFQDFDKTLRTLSNKDPFKFIETLEDYSGKPVSQSFFTKIFSNFVDEKVKDSINYFIGYTYW